MTAGKRQLLFVIPSLSAGGGQRSLVNLLLQLDYGRFDVDLYMFSHEGIFLELLPPQVKLLPLEESFRQFKLPLSRSMGRLLRRGKLPLAVSRFMYAVNNRKTSHVALKEQAGWKYMSRSMRRLSKTYDAAIGFLEKSSIYYCVEKVTAGTKIGWIHNDYDELGMDARFDGGYFVRLDHIVTVSESCGDVLKRRFPEHAGKVKVIYNIVSPAFIGRMAEAEGHDLYDRSGDETVIVSIGRLHPQKGFDIAVRACRLLMDRGCRFRWYVIGEGEERGRLEELIRELGAEERFRLLGLRSNPYPYLRQADIYVQTSRYEGKAIAIDEAKILRKPIVITDFSTARDQLEHGIEGLIVDMAPEAVAEAVAEMIGNRLMRERFVRYLSGLQLGTEAEIDKIYGLLHTKEHTAHEKIAVHHE